MSISASDSAWLARRFEPTDMQALNEKAAMLQRLDNKYIVEAEVLADALPILTRHFDMLEIGGLRSFSYENCYFDGPRWESYFDHHQGRRRRAKVRMRKYLDADLCFVEVKLKDKRGITVKRRFPCDVDGFGFLDDGALNQVGAAYRDMYQQDFPNGLSRTLDTFYRRMTLVAKRGGERMTIDNCLRFSADGRSKEIEPQLFILETKSANGNGLADRILRGFHQHPMKHCSKYCTGMVFMRDGLKHNNFKSVVRRLGSVPDTAFDAIHPGPAASLDADAAPVI